MLVEVDMLNRKNQISSETRTIMTALSLVVVFSILILTASVMAQSELSVPAEFVRELDPPGTSNSLLRPEQVYIDKKFSEVYVTDTGNNRIAVFDTSGVFKFDFSGREEFGSPTDIVVSSTGYIFVVGTSVRNGRSVFKFDYDGSYMGRLEVTSLPDSVRLDIIRISIDDSDNLYLLMGSNNLVVKVDGQGQYLGEFSILGDLTEKERREIILGSPRIDADFFYLPVPLLSNVYVYSLSGNFVRTIGNQGNKVGELNFPTAVDVIDHSIVVILDKHRFNVVCFTTEGSFLGEFGGMGYSLGWFYHPQYLATDKLGKIYISQGYLSRVQVCGLPQFIAEKVKSSVSLPTSSQVQPLLLEATKEEVSLEIQNSLMYSRSFSF